MTNIASLIGQRIDFSGVRVLRGQCHILSKNSSYASGISLMIFGSLIMGMIALFCFDRTFVSVPHSVVLIAQYSTICPETSLYFGMDIGTQFHHSGDVKNIKRVCQGKKSILNF